MNMKLPIICSSVHYILTVMHKPLNLYRTWQLAPGRLPVNSSLVLFISPESRPESATPTTPKQTRIYRRELRASHYAPKCRQRPPDGSYSKILEQIPWQLLLDNPAR